MLKKILITSLVASGLAYPSIVSGQTAVVADDPSLRINMAGRQRMLSQRIAKAACLMSQDIDTTNAFDQMSQAFALFKKSDTDLRAGNVELGLAKEVNEPVLKALGRIDSHWDNYSQIIQTGLDEGFIEEEDLRDLNQASLKVLKFMNIAVYKTARTYAQDTQSIDLGLAITIDVAGRQRMLTQRAVKSACMMRVADDPTIHADDVASTMELFHSSLQALQDGFDEIGVVPPPNAEVARTLREVSELWQPVRVTLDRAAKGEVLSIRDLGNLAREAEPLLRTMNEAVGLYKQKPPSS